MGQSVVLPYPAPHEREMMRLPEPKGDTIMGYRTWEVRQNEKYGGKPYTYPWYVLEVNKRKSLGRIECYGVDTKEKAELHAEEYRAEDEKREEVKAQRRKVRLAEKKAKPNLFQIGMIFENSWGYDQTNVDYYQVVRITPRGCYIRPIGRKSVVGSDGFMSDSVVPDKNGFSGPEVFKIADSWKDTPSFAVEHGCATLIDEWEATYRSWYA